MQKVSKSCSKYEKLPKVFKHLVESPSLEASFNATAFTLMIFTKWQTGNNSVVFDTFCQLILENLNIKRYK